MPSPDLFTVTEAAVVLRIGRTTAYELVRRDFDTGGAEGLGVVRIGGQFRIPRSALERILGGPVTWPASADLAGMAHDAGSASADPRHSRPSAPPPSPAPCTGEPTLPFPC